VQRVADGPHPLFPAPGLTAGPHRLLHALDLQERGELAQQARHPRHGQRQAGQHLGHVVRALQFVARAEGQIVQCPDAGGHRRGRLPQPGYGVVSAWTVSP
jgi:hypothetical protein